jgi:hypothetical protein
MSRGFAAVAFLGFFAATSGIAQGPARDSADAGAPVPNWGAMKKAAEDDILGRLVDPDSAKFDWPNGFILGTWSPKWARKNTHGYFTCGTVNSRNRMGGYAGTSSFVAMFDGIGSRLWWTLVDTQARPHLIAMECDRIAGQFPPPQAGMANVRPLRGRAEISSLADEISKLAALRDKGILTEEEFQMQKAVLLNAR